MKPASLVLTGLLSFASSALPLGAWDYEGHRVVNQLALAALPPDFPAFVRAPANAERIAFLAGEADRWRNVPDLPVKHSGGSWTDHFCDLEYLPEAGLDLDKISSFRYEFVVQFAAGRAANAGNFKPIDPARNADRTQEWPGFAPWAITEAFGRLRSGFSYLRVLEELGTPEEIENARANIVYMMGLMGHNVGDCAQPLHTTKHYNGWSGHNPKGYTTWNGIHAWIDGGLAAKAGIRLAPLLPQIGYAEVISLAPREDRRDPMFVAVFDYLRRQHTMVEPLYLLEKEGKLGQAEGAAVSDEARTFVEQRLLDGGRMLAAIWLTACRGAVPDTYLRAALVRRQAAAAKSAP
jgi:hypothetical protein